MNQLYKALPQFENNPSAAQQLPRMLCFFKWMRVIFYAMCLISFLGITGAIYEYDLLTGSNILEKITIFTIVGVVGLSVYGLCLACCLQHAFKRMEAGETTPQGGNGQNRSITIGGGRRNPYELRQGNTGGTQDEENSGNNGNFKAFKGKGQRIG